MPPPFPRLENAARIFHEPDCPGVITSVQTASGPMIFLHCAECRACVGTLDEPIFRQLITLLARIPGN